jgi:hypothetical protein
MVDHKWIPPEQQLARTFQGVERRLTEQSRSTGTERNLTVQELQKALQELQDAQEALAAVVAQQAQQIAIINSTRPVSATGGTALQVVPGNSWATTDQPQVTFMTATGVARIDVQAVLLATGTSAAIATFGLYRQSDGAVLISRETNRDNWRGLLNGILGVLAGSSFVIVGGLPVNTPIVARFECWSFTENSQYRSPSISAAGTA